MTLFERHKISTAFLGLYLLLWAFIIYYYLFKPQPDQPTCDFTPLVVIFFSPIIALIYISVLLIKFFTSKKSFNTDYLFFIVIVIFPLVIGMFYLMGM